MIVIIKRAAQESFVAGEGGGGLPKIVGGACGSFLETVTTSDQKIFDLRYPILDLLEQSTPDFKSLKLAHALKNNKLNALTTPGSGFECGPYEWEASALNTVYSWPRLFERWITLSTG